MIVLRLCPCWWLIMIMLMVVDHVLIYQGLMMLYFWFGLLVVWYIDFNILSKVWIIKINDKKQFKTIKNNKKQ